MLLIYEVVIIIIKWSGGKTDEEGEIMGKVINVNRAKNVFIL
jgi:hypothetical protein